MKELVRAARDFAIAAHRGQERKYVGGPYILHVEEVAGIIAAADLSVAAQAASWLHDVVEDCEVTLRQIDAQFGTYVSVLVRDLTNTPESSGLSTEERKAKDIERLRFVAPEAQSIKCADLISNISTIVQRAPEKARGYVPARRKVLDVLTGAKPELLTRARAVMRDAEKALVA